MTELTSILSFQENDQRWSRRLCSLVSNKLCVFKESSFEDVDFSIIFDKDTKVEKLSTDSLKFSVTQEQNEDHSTVNKYIFRCDSLPSLNTWFFVLSSCAALESPISINDFSIITILGNGKYGKVQLAKLKEAGDFFAMKVIHKKKLPDARKYRAIFSEKNAFCVSCCPFIVHTHFAFQNEKKFYLCLEYVPGGDLFTHMRESGTIPIDELKLYVAEIAIALNHLHQHNIIYRDLKPENVLLDERGHAKLCDFGLSTQLSEDNSTASSFCGTYEYLAPEIIQGKEYGQAVDWWSLGILIYEMVFRQTPFYSIKQNRMFEKIINGNIIFPGVVDRNLINLIKGLLNRNPSKRYGFEDVMKHPLFSSFSIDKLINKEYHPCFIPKSNSADFLEEECQREGISEISASKSFQWVNDFGYYNTEEFQSKNLPSSASSSLLSGFVGV